MNLATARTEIQNSRESQATLLMDVFAKDPKAGLIRKEQNIGGLNFFEFTALYKSEIGDTFFGHGQSTDEQLALIKAVAELYERRELKNYFKDLRDNRIQKNIPAIYEHSSLRSSNGWAVHFDHALATDAAINEALERHILLLSYLKDGWLGFIKIDEQIVDDIKFTSLISRYECSGVQAGMIIAKSPKQAGVTFGYFSEATKNIRTSPKWAHALCEAKCQLDGFFDLSTADFKESHVVENSILNYLKNFWAEPVFAADDRIISLPTVAPQIQSFDLSESFGVPLVAVNATGGGLFPLFFPRTISAQAKAYLSPLFLKNGISTPCPERIPIL